MLLINGVIACIGMIIAYIVVHLQHVWSLAGDELILVSGLGLWLFLFLADVVEEKLIDFFNKGP